MVTALYLAHLNPVTTAHTQIIEELINDADKVMVLPVIFRDGQREINSKSFPFNFELRKKMLESIFDKKIKISDGYC